MFLCYFEKIIYIQMKCVSKIRLEQRIRLIIRFNLILIFNNQKRNIKHQLVEEC